jgi:hypothetical protein
MYLSAAYFHLILLVRLVKMRPPTSKTLQLILPSGTALYLEVKQDFTNKALKY